MKNDTTSSLVPGEAITFGVHAFWDMSIEWKKSINQEDSHHKTCLSCVAPWCGPGSGPGHHTWNEPELTLDYKGEICWRTEWNCQHHLCEDETIYCLVCGCCLAGAADLTRHRKYRVILRVSCVLSPVCLVCAGRVFITRDDQEEDSVGHRNKLEHQQWMCYLMHSFRQMRN